MDIWLMKAGGVSNLAIHLKALNLYLETLSIVQVLSTTDQNRKIKFV